MTKDNDQKKGSIMVKCPVCSFENEDGALFCDQCKSDLGGEPMALSASGQALPLSAEEANAPTVPMPEAGPPVAAVVVGGLPESDTVPLAEVATEGRTATEELLRPGAPSAEPQGTPPAAIPVSETPVAQAVTDQTLAEALPQAVAPLAPPEAGTQPDKLAEGARPKLVVLRGQRVNAEYQIYEGDNYIGRADEKPVDVDLEDQEPPDRVWSSRQHALITFENGQLAIEDLNSLNGTFVNRTRVAPGQKRPLQINDVIQIGTVQMKVKV
jgi:hypothetical protein